MTVSHLPITCHEGTSRVEITDIWLEYRYDSSAMLFLEEAIFPALSFKYFPFCYLENYVRQCQVSHELWLLCFCSLKPVALEWPWRNRKPGIPVSRSQETRGWLFSVLPSALHVNHRAVHLSSEVSLPLTGAGLGFVQHNLLSERTRLCGMVNLCPPEEERSHETGTLSGRVSEKLY